MNDLKTSLLLPDGVLVILAGYSINNHSSNHHIYSDIKEFHTKFRTLPDVEVISAQTKLRLYTEGNKLDSPFRSDYHRRRLAVNNLLARQ